MKKHLIICCSFLLLILSACSASRISRLRSDNMEKLQLEMSKEEVSAILGKAYTIAEKSMDAKDTIEIISYRNFPYDDEFYLFKFRNNKLEKWYRELDRTYKEAPTQ